AHPHRERLRRPDAWPTSLPLFCTTRRLQASTLFPYTTLFRSVGSSRSGSRTGRAWYVTCYPAGMERRSEGGRLGERSDHFEARRSEEHTSELQSRGHLVFRLLLQKKYKRPSPALGSPELVPEL